MTTRGTFELITNNGTPDKLLIAHTKLCQRLELIKAEKIKKVNDNLNLLYDKFNQLKEEINIDPKLSNINNKKIQLIKQQIDILKKTNTSPTISDIELTHDFFLKSTYKPFVSIGSEYSKNIVSIKPQLGGVCSFKIPKYGDFFSDMVLYLKLTEFSAINPVNKVRYCEFPGHRIVNQVKIILNGDIIDRYYTEDYNFYYQYGLPLDKQIGWKKCVGQEIPIEAHLTSDPDVQEFREVKFIKNGPQTLKKTQPPLEMFIPLLFWFTDPKHAMSTKHISLQSYIEVNFGKKDEITACDNIAGDTGLLYVPPKIEESALYIRHLFIEPEIMEIFINRVGFSLIRVHKHKEQIINNSFFDVPVNDFNWPTELFYVAVRPLENLSGANSMDTWYLNNKLTLTNIRYPIIYGADIPGIVDASFYQKEKILTNLCLGCEEASIYESISSTFFNAYIPYKYGKSNNMSPSDTDSYLINFHLNDGLQYQPHGYLNLSRTKLFNLSYGSELISGTFPCNLIISSIAINFILLENESCKLYYPI